MALKKAELYRGFNVFVEEIRPGAWGVSVVEIPSSGGLEKTRPAQRVRVPGEHASKEAGLAAARAHIDRVHQNRKNRMQGRE